MKATADDTVSVAALVYRARGWSVVPIEPRGKRPLIRWEGLQHALASETEVRSWFRRWPDANVGIVTGTVSGIVVLDVDPRHDGDESLIDLARQYSPLPETTEALTGGGGRHLYFRQPPASLRNRASLAPGLDLRGDGGLVVAPPSVHPSGRRYVWEVSHHPDDVILAAMPDWLLGLCRGENHDAGHSVKHWRALVREGVAAGVRNSTIASLTGHLLHRGIDPDVACELMLCWNRVRCRPPLNDDEVARTVESITRTHFRHRQDETDG